MSSSEFPPFIASGDRFPTTFVQTALAGIFFFLDFPFCGCDLRVFLFSAENLATP